MKSAWAMALLAVMLLVPPARAAMISITATNAENLAYDLTGTYGTADWAYWGQTGSALTAPVAPSNQKAGADLIGGITAYNGTGVRGSTSTTKPIYDFAFADGAVAESGTVSNLIGLFNRAIGAAGVGVQVEVAAPTADPFILYVWGTAYGCTGTLTASIDTAAAADSALVLTNTRSPGRLYTIAVDPDFAGQTVTLRMSTSSMTDTANGNASIAAVAVYTTVPEPAALGVVLVGALGLGGRGRRRPR